MCIKKPQRMKVFAQLKDKTSAQFLPNELLYKNSNVRFPHLNKFQQSHFMFQALYIHLGKAFPSFLHQVIHNWFVTSQQPPSK